MIRRLMVVLAMTALGGALCAAPAFAAETSQGRTYGGTAYGVDGRVTIRRPGVTGANHYDMKLGARSGVYAGDYFYVGYRSDSAGNATYIAQYTIGGSTSTVPRGRVNHLSNARPRFGVSIFGNDYFYAFPEGDPYYLSYGASSDSFDTVFARSYMSDSTYMSASSALDLRYYPVSGSPLFWGNPVAQSTTPGACGRFEGTTAYYYAHQTGC